MDPVKTLNMVGAAIDVAHQDSNEQQALAAFGGSVNADADAKTIRLREFVRLTALKRDLETRLKDAKGRLGDIETALTEQFQQDGMQSVNIDGYTVYLNRSLFAGPKDGNKEGLIAALKACPEDWSFLVQENFNSNSLKARVRECEMGDDNMPVIPESLRDVLAIYEEYSIGARKSTK